MSLNFKKKWKHFATISFWPQAYFLFRIFQFFLKIIVKCGICVAVRRTHMFCFFTIGFVFLRWFDFYGLTMLPCALKMHFVVQLTSSPQKHPILVSANDDTGTDISDHSSIMFVPNVMLIVIQYKCTFKMTLNMHVFLCKFLLNNWQIETAELCHGCFSSEDILTVFYSHHYGSILIQNIFQRWQLLLRGCLCRHFCLCFHGNVLKHVSMRLGFVSSAVFLCDNLTMLHCVSYGHF